MRRREVAGLLVTLLLAWLVAYPLLLTGLESVRAPGGWTLEHWARFASAAHEWRTLWASLWIAAASVVLAGAVGIPLGFVMERFEFPGRRLLGALAALPIALPPLVGVIAFLFLYGESGFVSRAVQAALGLREAPWRLRGPGAILLVHAYSMYVYFYLYTRAGLARLDASMLEAAASLGAGRWRTFTRVTLPLLRPPLVGAAILTFMTALASFSAPYIFGGGFRVMTTQIVASKLSGDLAMATVETLALAAVALAGLTALRRTGGGRDMLGSGQKGAAAAPRQLRGGLPRTLAAVAGWGIAALLLLPHATLLLVSLVPPGAWTTELLPPLLSASNYGALLREPERLRPILNSLGMAAASTIAAVTLALVAARLVVVGRVRVRGWIEGLLSAPWAMPGTVFAMALATAFSVQQPWAGRWILVGTFWILPLAYLVRSLPLTGWAALAGLRQLDPALEEAAASLGAGRWRTLTRVTIPMIGPALAAGASLAFIMTLGDFVTSIVLYTYETRPISIEILAALREFDLGIAAAYGICLTALSALAFALGERRRGERRGERRAERREAR
ncbi:MAG: iron ABC transporter permease [Gemmatimonadetes bacterium]|nr:iron ABC transporter permease [Gemmatimonadota bacterium]